MKYIKRKTTQERLVEAIRDWKHLLAQEKLLHIRLEFKRNAHKNKIKALVKNLKQPHLIL